MKARLIKRQESLKGTTIQQITAEPLAATPQPAARTADQIAGEPTRRRGTVQPSNARALFAALFAQPQTCCE